MQAREDNFLFGTNFKMHQTPAESRQFVSDLQHSVLSGSGVQVFLIPPYTSLPGLAAMTSETGFWLGAQNMHWAESGAYTGEISAAMLRAIEVDLVLLGHAERRKYFNETDATLQKKVETACQHDLRMLLCVGETAEQQAANNAPKTLSFQLKSALYGFDLEKLPLLNIAYEPVWAIGEGGQPAPEPIVAASVEVIRSTLHELFDEHGASVPILYGGSVTPENCKQYARLKDIDGLFVGRAAWQVGGFVQVLRLALEARYG